MNKILIKKRGLDFLRKIYHWLKRNSIYFGSFRRLTPISRYYGYDRGGKPIDRYYIEKFLSSNSGYIKGHVLEIEDNTYTKRFGGAKVLISDVLHVRKGNPNATIVADLTKGDNIPSNSFECIILTQTLQCIYDIRAAIKTLYRILKPGGVLLATFHGISQYSRNDMDNWGEYWRFTNLSARMIFEEVFPKDKITVKGYGNVLSSISFLHGISWRELKKNELDYYDPSYELIVALRAIKSLNTN
jgi:SAM-dependent methyltransferase